jgi:type IV pilus assembly protein PilC
MNYVYRGRKTGNEVSGVIEAMTRKEAIALLRLDGVVPTSIKEQKVRKKKSSTSSRKINSGLLSMLCDQLYVMIKNGMKIFEAFELLEEEIEITWLRKVFKSMINDLYNGITIASSMEKYNVFPSTFIGLVNVGEESGSLQDIFKSAAVNYRKDYEMAQKVRSSLMYPAIVVVLSIGVLIYMVTKVIPQFADIMLEMNITLPQTLETILRVNGFIQDKWLQILSLIAVVIYGIYRFTKTKTFGLISGKMVLELPVFGKIVKDIIVTKLCRTTAMLLNSGIPPSASLEMLIPSIGNHCIAEDLKQAKELVTEGENMSFAFESSKHIPRSLKQSIAMGERTGDLAAVLSSRADFYEQKTNFQLARLLTLIEPVIMIIVAIVVGFIVLTLFIPLFDAISGF